MNNMNAFGRSLEVQIIGGCRILGWKQVWGENFAVWSSHYMIPFGGLASRAACERTLVGDACSYRIVEHEDGTLVGVCDEGYCKRKEFPREELVLYTINEDKLVKELSSIFGLIQGNELYPTQGRARRIGSLKNTQMTPVIFMRKRDANDFYRFLIEFYALRRTAAVFVFPTDRRINENCWKLIHDYQSQVFILDGNAIFTPQGMSLTEEGKKLWQNIVASTSPKRGYDPVANNDDESFVEEGSANCNSKAHDRNYMLEEVRKVGSEIKKTVIALKQENDLLKESLAEHLSKVGNEVEPEFFFWIMTILGAGSVHKAAQMLGMANSTLRDKLKLYSKRSPRHQLLLKLTEISRTQLKGSTMERFNDAFIKHGKEEPVRGGTALLQEIL